MMRRIEPDAPALHVLGDETTWTTWVDKTPF
jgi:hypothetical protein